MQITKRTIKNEESENYYLRVERGGRAFLRSLGTGVKSEAERRAKLLVKAIENEKWADVDKTKIRQNGATIADVLTIYREKATDVKRREASALALLMIVGEAFPGRNAETVRVSELSKLTVREFEEARLQRVGKVFKRYENSTPRVMNEYSVRTTIRSALIKARAVFARDKMRYYEGLALGEDLKGFLTEPVQWPERRRPQAPDEVGLARMLAALPALRAEDPAVYVSWILMARLGMRPIEVRQAREWWVRSFNGMLMMEISQRPDEGFDPKGSSGSVPLAADVWAELQTFAPMRTDGFLVPGATKTDRAHVVERRLSDWVGQFVRGRGTTTSYELRRWAGSLVMDAHNGDVTAARDFLRHADMKTTLEWYAYRLTKVQPLGMGGLVAPPVQAAVAS
jgi:integrase